MKTTSETRRWGSVTGITALIPSLQAIVLPMFVDKTKPKGIERGVTRES